MKTQSGLKSMLAIAATAVLFAACSSAPTKPDGADNVRNRLARLQDDPQLASRAPVAIKEAEAAVVAAEEPRKDLQLSRHLVVLADRKVDLAEAQAQTRWLEDQRKSLNEQQQTARLDARTREAESARRDADTARVEANSARVDAGIAQRDETSARAAAEVSRIEADSARADTGIAQREQTSARAAADHSRIEADSARTDAGIAQRDETAALASAAQSRADAENARIQVDVARSDTAAAERRSDQLQRAAKLESDELQRQIAALNAKKTDRGLVVTLGDVLFSTGQSDLKGGAQNNLSKLADFLNKYPESNVSIEGHTDNIGNDAMNQELSQRRAASVKAFLTSHGVGTTRLSATGKGESTPIAGNDSATGRQQNRRVEVIIANSATSAAVK